jgi:hypothetical protein
MKRACLNKAYKPMIIPACGVAYDHNEKNKYYHMKKLTLILIAVFTIVLDTFALPTDQVKDSIRILALKQKKDSILKITKLDYKNMMDQLNILSVRPGLNYNINSNNPANYDELKANPYTKLPDPLVMKDGKKVTSAKIWLNKRRPEIYEDFNREIMGRVPENTPEVRWEVIKTESDTIGSIPVNIKSLVGHVDNSIYPSLNVDIILELTTPANSKGPVPLILELSWFLPSKSLSQNPENNEKSWQQQVLEKGWGYAGVIPTSVQADNGAGLREGIIGLMNKGQYRKPEDWGALRAWAWGASRVLDYLKTNKSVDAKQVGITGHSRYGKAALIAMAYDSRFAIAYITSSGEGGAKLYRRFYGETVENIASYGAYHWMAGNYLKYAGPLTSDDLPVDAHELIALCAPRPVFIGGGDKGDEWSDPKGMFMATAYASPVYRLLGKKGLGTDIFPQVETTVAGGNLAFRQHKGGHTPVPNWPAFIEFASRFLKVK